MFKTSLTSCAAVLLVAGCAYAQPAAAPAKMSEGALVDAQGMTLYTFDRDTANSGKSACSGACASLWPPAMASASDQPSGAFGIVTRDNGSRQWSYHGKPLYTYQADKKPGDRNGDNFKDMWHIVNK